MGCKARFSAYFLTVIFRIGKNVRIIEEKMKNMLKKFVSYKNVCIFAFPK